MATKAYVVTLVTPEGGRIDAIEFDMLKAIKVERDLTHPEHFPQLKEEDGYHTCITEVILEL
jgi:hypothetical protein